MNGKKSVFNDRIQAILLALIIFSPYIWIFFQVDQAMVMPGVEAWHGFQNTFFQAFVSTFITMVLALFCAPGYLKFHESNIGKKINIFLILPSLLPPIFILIVTLSAVKNFPRGFFGVLILHVSINLGLATVIVGRLIGKISQWNELCYNMGLTQAKYIWRVALPLLKNDFFALFLFIFLNCFLSFAIPLVMAGSEFSTLEVYIYNIIFNFNRWGLGLSLIFFQIIFVLMVVMLFPSPESSFVRQTNKIYFPYGLKRQVLPALFPSVFFLVTFFSILPHSFVQTFKFHKMAFEIENFLVGSFTVSLGTGILTMLQLTFYTFFYQNRLFQKLLLYYFPPATTVIALVGSFIFSFNSTGKIFVISLCLSWIWAPALYRLKLYGALEQIKNQIEQAQIMGARKNYIWLKIIFPQVLPEICFLAAISGFWASGEFALTDLVNPQDLTLAQWIKSLLDNYRFEASLVLLVPQMLLGIVIFFIFSGASFVGSYSSKKKL